MDDGTLPYASQVIFNSVPLNQSLSCKLHHYESYLTIVKHIIPCKIIFNGNKPIQESIKIQFLKKFLDFDAYLLDDISEIIGFIMGSRYKVLWISSKKYSRPHLLLWFREGGLVEDPLLWASPSGLWSSWLALLLPGLFTLRSSCWLFNSVLVSQSSISISWLSVFMSNSSGCASDKRQRKVMPLLVAIDPTSLWYQFDAGNWRNRLIK